MAIASKASASIAATRRASRGPTSPMRSSMRSEAVADPDIMRRQCLRRRSAVKQKTLRKIGNHADRDHRHRLCRPGLRRLFLGFRASTWSASTRTRPRSSALQAGEMPIYEPGLDGWSRATSRAGRLAFTTDLARRRAGPTRSSSRSARRRAAATAMPISATSIARRRGDRRGARPAPPSSSPSRRCRSAPATRSSASSARRVPTPTSPSPPIPSSCAKARRSRISCVPTGW